MKKIPLSRGLFALVDDADFEWLNGWKWTATNGSSRSKRIYAYRPIRIGGKHVSNIMMHQQILDTPKGFDTDHKNRDGLDNRRENIRVVSRTQNNYNLGLKKNNTSGYRGISWSKHDKRWRAYIGGSKTREELGHYKTIEEAVIARKEAEKWHILPI